MKTVKPTKEEFMSYLCEQALGRYNMVSTDARNRVGIEKEKYDYILMNYDALVEEYGVSTESREIREYAKMAKMAGL